MKYWERQINLMRLEKSNQRAQESDQRMLHLFWLLHRYLKSFNKIDNILELHWQTLKYITKAWKSYMMCWNIDQKNSPCFNLVKNGRILEGIIWMLKMCNLWKSESDLFWNILTPRYSQMWFTSTLDKTWLLNEL